VYSDAINFERFSLRKSSKSTHGIGPIDCMYKVLRSRCEFVRTIVKQCIGLVYSLFGLKTFSPLRPFTRLPSCSATRIRLSVKLLHRQKVKLNEFSVPVPLYKLQWQPSESRPILCDV